MWKVTVEKAYGQNGLRSWKWRLGIFSLGALLAWGWMPCEPSPAWGSGLASYEIAPGSPLAPKGAATDLSSIGRRISQKQYRHIKGRPEWARKQGGYLTSMEDAQKVLDATHDGSAQVLGTTKQGHTVVRFDEVTGFNNNPGVGIVDQPTNVFLIKGTSNPSVVPTSPTWTP